MKATESRVVACPRSEHEAVGDLSTKVDISQAARWLATTPQQAQPHPIIPHLRKAYGLSPSQAVAAIREANLIRARAA